MSKSDQPAGVAVDREVMPAVGDYVLATKYDDGDPGDHWALGFYAGELDMGNDREKIKVARRYLVNDSSGKTIRPNGYRRVARVRKDVGAWLLNVAAKQLEQSPPGTVNLWTMLTPAAFDVSDEHITSKLRPRRQASRLERPVGRLFENREERRMTYPCEHCNMDDWSPVCLGDKRCPNAASADRAFGPVRINGQLYTRPVIRVAVVTWGGSSCTVPVGELLAVIEDGGPYTVEIKTMALRDFEALPEFAGW